MGKQTRRQRAEQKGVAEVKRDADPASARNRERQQDAKMLKVSRTQEALQEQAARGVTHARGLHARMGSGRMAPTVKTRKRKRR